MNTTNLGERLRRLGKALQPNAQLPDTVLDIVRNRKPVRRRVSSGLAPTAALAASLVLVVALAVGGTYGEAVAALRDAAQSRSLTGLSVFGTLFLLVPLIVVYAATFHLIYRMSRRWQYAALGMLAVTCALGSLYAALGGFMATLPTPVPITETLEVRNQAGNLTITRLRVASVQPDLLRVVLDVANGSEAPEDLGLEYYENGGRIALVYSPGARAGALVQEVQGNWSGSLAFDLPAMTFGHGGRLDLGIYRCTGVGLDPNNPLFINRDAELLLEKSYVLTP